MSGADPSVTADVPIGVFAAKYGLFRDIPYRWNHQGREPSWTEPITADEVREALREGRLRPDLTSATRQENIERIAFLAQAEWGFPVSVRVVLPAGGEPGGWELIDGYHRLHAAAVRGDAAIPTKFHNLCKWYLTPFDIGWLESEFGCKIEV